MRLRSRVSRLETFIDTYELEFTTPKKIDQHSKTWNTQIESQTRNPGRSQTRNLLEQIEGTEKRGVGNTKTVKYKQKYTCWKENKYDIRSRHKIPTGS